MKNLSLVAGFALCLFTQSILAQNNTMGVGTTTPNPNAVLHVESAAGNQGFIMPRLTTTQRTGLSSLLTATDKGLMVYDSDLTTLYIWNGTSWRSGVQLAYPYKDSVTSLPDSSTAFRIKYDGHKVQRIEVARFENTNMLNYAYALEASTTGTGGAGHFIVNNEESHKPALAVVTNSTMTANTAFVAQNKGTGNIAVFSNATEKVARIDQAGEGFFNGGVTTGGADLAELFAVQGERSAYGPGDVLVISEMSDRTVEKSQSPNCTRVVGVYATKPGVLLTEKSIDEDTGDMVPMGVVGVLPTKVCTENGPIRRGDLLVTASEAGHAMKAVPVMINGTPVYPTGAVLGKALENFDGEGTGLINVLVNVK